MQQKDVVIKSEEGLHARPASRFVEKAMAFKAKISVRKDDKLFNAKSMLAILSMGAVKGETITILAEGEDETEAIAALHTIMNEETA